MQTNTIWVQSKSKHKLSLGQTPTHQFDNSWGRYSFSTWITQKKMGSMPYYLSNEFNEDLTFKDKIDNISLE